MSSEKEASGHPSSQTHSRKHSRSSVGEISVGDVSPSLTTMDITRAMRRRSDARLKHLREDPNTDTALLKKMYFCYRELCYRNSWIRPLIVLGTTSGLYMLSGKDTRLHKVLEAFVTPSYNIEGTDQYGKGFNDFLFVGFYAIFFTFLREFLMGCVLAPIAHYFGINRQSKVKRFMEQTYSMFYYGCSGPFGLWIMHRLPLWYFETIPFYEHYPHRTHDWYFKVYYLGQAAFWVQQSVVLVLQLEKPRKDFKELVLHHIITIALIWTSYRFHFTWMGLEIYITMDVSDFFLATSKTLNYLDSPFTPPALIFFLFVWVYLRHYINLRILWSVLTEYRTVGDYTLNWDTQQYKCWISQPIVFTLIFALQLVNAYWLVLILRILWRYIVGGVQKDERSDDEDSEDEEEEKEKEKKNE